MFGSACVELSCPLTRLSISPVPPSHAPDNQKEKEKNDGESQHREKVFFSRSMQRYTYLKMENLLVASDRERRFVFVIDTNDSPFQPERRNGMVDDNRSIMFRTMTTVYVVKIVSKTSNHCYLTHPRRDPRIIFSLEV